MSCNQNEIYDLYKQLNIDIKSKEIKKSINKGAILRNLNYTLNYNNQTNCNINRK